jgi:hypothetical protein
MSLVTDNQICWFVSPLCVCMCVCMRKRERVAFLIGSNWEWYENVNMMVLCHHTLWIWVHIIISYGDCWRTVSTGIIHIWLKNWKVKSQLLWRASLMKHATVTENSNWCLQMVLAAQDSYTWYVFAWVMNHLVLCVYDTKRTNASAIHWDISI